MLPPPNAVSEKPFKTFFNNLFPKRRPSRPTSFSVLNATHSPGADSPDMTVQDPRATPSPPSTVPSPNDTTESNASDVSEVEELAPKKTHATVARGSVSESESAKTRAVKHDIADSEEIIPYLIPESSELETEDVQVHHWLIKDWKALEDRCHGPVFQAGGFPWRILLFPRGNNQDTSISVYLEVADPTSSGHPPDWHVCAYFALVISNPEDSTNFYSSSANHRFSADEVDWGFTKFVDIKSLPRTNPSTGKGPFLVNNQVMLSVFVRVIKDETGVLWHSFQNYDSRKETGYVGIKNQGATCYMNSLLQSLYCTNSFRRAVYQIPTENDKLSDSVSLALQRCFYQLQYSDLPVGTTELTRSFGWDSLEAFNQHDVQEFNRVLQDRLEEKMKGTPADGAISKLFLGKMKSYIKCINVDYESSRVEDYYDIQLNVKGCKDLEESFQHYVTVETLEGENMYMAEGHGLQDAKKGVIFESFPPVLHLQLKRFEYDFMRDTMVKINDRHEFPEEINLDKFCSQSDPNDPYDYVLHGVLVHSGDLHGGHYFALIKPEKDGKWLRFDDDRVTPVKRREVFEENYGDEPLSANGSPPMLNGVRNNNARLMKRFTNAYMLVYIRKSKLDEVLGPVNDEDIPPHLKRRIDEERAALEKRRKDREEMHLHVKVAVVTDSSFANRQEFDLAAFDDKNLECSEGVTVFKVLKTDKVCSLRPALIERFGLQNEKFRLWPMTTRSNKITRVENHLTATEEKQSFEKLRACIYTQNTGLVKLYLESADHLPNGKLPNVRSDLSMIFIKYFDIKQQKMIGLGRMYVKSHDKVGEMTPTLLERAKLPKDTVLSFYEEVKPASIEFMNVKQSFQQSSIQNGDIICCQIAVNEEQAKQIHAEGRFATVREYFTSVYNRVMVEFRPKTDKQLQEITLTLDRRSTYLTVARELAKALEAEPTKLRFTTAHSLTKQPKDVLPYSARLTLEIMAPGIPNATEYAHAVNIESVTRPVIYYEILDVSLVDLETKKSFKINTLYPTLRDETPVEVLVQKNGVGKDLVQGIISKSKFDTKDLDRIRVFEVVDGQIVTELSLDQPIDGLGAKVGATLYAEQIPDEELLMDQDNDIVIQVVHYNKDPLRLHGVPFRFVVKKDEPFTETKKRLQKRIGISDKEWQKVKYTVVRNISSVDPEATAIEGDFKLSSAKIGADDALGLDRVDKSKTSRFGGMFERGIFIRG